MKPPLFPLGDTVATPGALEALNHAGQLASWLLLRHNTGDWGEMEPEDKALNDASVLTAGRLHSAYVLSTGVKIWVITEADRSVTTLLLPDEY